MKLNKVHFIAISFIIWFVGIFFFNYDNMVTPKEKFLLDYVHSVCESSFSGIVTNKLIDKKDHSEKKITIDKNGKKKIIMLTLQQNDLFNYISIGDTISKKKNSLLLILRNKTTDTILKFKFENVKHYNTFSHLLTCSDTAGIQ